MANRPFASAATRPLSTILDKALHRLDNSLYQYIGEGVTMLKLRHLSALLALGILLFSGCPNPALMHGARTVGQGHHEFTAAIGVIGLDTRYLGGEGTAAGAIAPNAEVMYRGGVTDYFDIGVSLTGLGMINLDFKFELFDTDIVTLAVDPGVGGVFLGVGDVATGYLQLQMPFMVDIHAHEVVSIQMGAKYSGFYSFASQESLGTADAFTHWMGGTLGLRFNINESYAVMPYGGFMMPLAGAANGLENIAIWSGGIGFIYRL